MPRRSCLSLVLALASSLLVAHAEASAQNDWCTTLGPELAQRSVTTLQQGLLDMERGEVPGIPAGTPAEVEAMYRSALSQSQDCVEYLQAIGMREVPVRGDFWDNAPWLDLGVRPGVTTPEVPAAPADSGRPAGPGAADPTALPEIPEIGEMEIREVGGPAQRPAEPAGPPPAQPPAGPCPFTLDDLRQLQASARDARFLTPTQRQNLAAQLRAQRACTADPAQLGIIDQLLPLLAN